MSKVARYIHTIFCDDVRQEVGDKISLMGVFQGIVNITTPPPVTLPKICVVVSINSPLDNPFEQLTIELLFNDEVIESFEFNDEMIASMTRIRSTLPDAIMGTAGVIFQLPSFTVNGPGIFVLRGISESEILISSKLRVFFQNDTSSDTKS